MRYKVYGTLLLLLMTVSVPVSARIGDGGYPGSFLRTGAGARPLGMGGAFVALADDGTAAFWNPAGLGQLDKPQITSMVTRMSLDRTHHFVAYAHPFKSFAVVSFSWLNYGVTHIDGRDLLGQPTGDFSDAENAYLVSAGKKMGRSFFIGGTLKLLNHRLADKKASGSGLDLGAMLRVGDTLRLGATIQNINAGIRWKTGSRLEEEYLTTTKLGVALSPGVPWVNVVADVEMNEKQKTQYHLGVESWFKRMLVARIGLNRSSFTAGGSVVVPMSAIHLELDYAFSPDILQQGGTHRVSILVKF